MMTEFWLLAGLLTLGALALIIPPLLRNQTKESGVDATALYTDLYDQRLAELQTEKDNGNLDDDQFVSAKEELARELLNDTETAVGHAGKTNGGRWVALAVIVTVPVLAVLLYQQLGASEQFALMEQTPATRSAQTPQAAPPQAGQSLPPVQDLVAGLAAKLEKDPTNTEGWVMLGRSYIALKQHKAAEDAYARAYALDSNNPDILSSYAEAMALSNDNKLTGKPTELIQRALELEPGNPEALWLGAMAAFQSGKPSQSLEHLRALLVQLEAGSPDAQMIQAQIERVEQQMKDTLDSIASPPAAVQAAPQPAPAPPSPSMQSTGIAVSVTLDDNLAAGISGSDTLFIYARAVTGPRMPLAISRLSANDLPVTVTLDDSSAMMPNMKLSGFDQVMIMARISKSGNAITQSGDFIGSTGPVQVQQTKDVSVVISQSVP